MWRPRDWKTINKENLTINEIVFETGADAMLWAIRREMARCWEDSDQVLVLRYLLEDCDADSSS